MVDLKEELDKIIKNKLIYPVFQPIVSLDSGEVLGYEGLSRLTETDIIKEPETLFKLAGVYGKTWDLEQICRKKILKSWVGFKGRNDTKLFMNVDPLTMTCKSFQEGFTKKYLAKQGISSENVVIEITERSAADNMHEFREVVEHYEKQGYGIAIDDAGSCYSGLNLICDIKPKYLKLDIGLVNGISKDNMKYAMVKSFAQFSKLTGVNLIAEGVEDGETLGLLLELGIQYGQGFFLGRPKKEPAEVLKKAKDIILQHSRQISSGSNDEYRAVIFRPLSAKAFRAYERKYGDQKADEIILQMEQAVKEMIHEEECEYEQKLNGTDIIALVKRERCNSFCVDVGSDFQVKMKEYYSEKEYERGFIKEYNKKGEQKNYPLIDVDYEVIM